MLTSALRVFINNPFYESFDIIFMRNEKNCQNIKSMFGNCFFPLFSIFKNIFSIFKTEKLVWQLKMGRKQKLFSKFNL